MRGQTQTDANGRGRTRTDADVSGPAPLAAKWPIPLGTIGPYPYAPQDRGNGRISDEIWSYRAENIISMYVVVRVEFKFDIRFCVALQKLMKHLKNVVF